MSSTKASNKKSSYMKMKERYEEEIKSLKDDIYNMVENKDKEKGILTTLKYKIKYDMEKRMWVGDVSVSTGSFFNGFTIKNNEPYQSL